MAKLNLYLNNTEIQIMSLYEIDYTFQKDGTYNISSFNSTAGSLNEISYTASGTNNYITNFTTSGTSDTTLAYTLTNNTAGLSWNSSYAYQFQTVSDVFVFYDSEYQLITP